MIGEINQRLLESLVKKKLVKGRKLRIDTTVVEANISYPTDAGLLYKGVKKLTKAVARIKKSFGNSTRERTPTLRHLKEDLLSITKVLNRRNNEKIKEVREITSKMAQTAKQVVKQTETFLTKLTPETQNDVKVKGNLLDLAKNVSIIINQAEAVNAGNTKISDRLISLEDNDARPIVKGKPGKRVEFGYKVQIQEVNGGIITGYQVYKGNPSDKTLVDDVLKQHQRIFKKAPNDLTMDRGYYDSKNEQMSYEAGVKNVCIPKAGKKSHARQQFEQTPIFKRLKRWRAGIEGRISCLKRRFGLDKSMLRGYYKTQLWFGLGIFAHNLRQVTKYMD